jgi:hypothetical protein
MSSKTKNFSYKVYAVRFNLHVSKKQNFKITSELRVTAIPWIWPFKAYLLRDSTNSFNIQQLYALPTL